MNTHKSALTRLQAEYRLRERAVTAAMADIVKVRIGSQNDGSALVGEALSEKFQALDRPLANLIHAALDGQDEISADNADLPAIGRLVWSVVTEYLRPMAEKRADESAADPFDEDDDAYEQYEQDVLDGVRAA